MKKYILSLLLTVSLLLPLFSFPVAAEDSLKDQLAEAIVRHEQSLDTSAWNYSPEAMDEFISQFKITSPEIFLVKEINFSISLDAEVIVKSLELVYHMDEAASSEAWNYCVNQAKSYAEQALKYSIPVANVLKLQELLVTNNSCADSASKPSVYDFFQNRSGDSLSVSLALEMICRYMGIPCETIYSPIMNHAWNTVILDGASYHIDVTADDAYSSSRGQISRKHLLLSDAALLSLGYVDFSQGNCTSTAFDHAFWKDLSSPFGYIGGYYFYLNVPKGGICRTGFLDSEGSLVLSIAKDWTDASGALSEQIHSGICYHNDKIYYNIPTQIMQYDPDSGDTSVYFSPVLKEGEQILNLWQSGSSLYYLVGTSADSAGGETYETPLPGVETYTIIFRVTETNTIVYTYKVEKGQALHLPPLDPTLPDSDNASYEFSHWEGFVNGMKAMENRVFDAVFRKIPYPTTPSIPEPTTPPPASSAPVVTRPPSVTTPKPTSPVPTPGSSAQPSAPASTAAPSQSSVPPSSTVAAPDTTVANTNQGNQINPEFSHHLPQITQGNQRPAYSSSAVCFDDEEEPKDETVGLPDESAAWIFAISGSLLVVGFIVFRELVLKPKSKNKEIQEMNQMLSGASQEAEIQGESEKTTDSEEIEKENINEQ